MPMNCGVHKAGGEELVIDVALPRHVNFELVERVRMSGLVCGVRDASEGCG